jgi:hypothetical protein
MSDALVLTHQRPDNYRALVGDKIKPYHGALVVTTYTSISWLHQLIRLLVVRPCCVMEPSMLFLLE